MKIIEYHLGCNTKPLGCFGPRDNFYTIFGTEVRNLTGHFLISAIVGISLICFLLFLSKKNKLSLSLSVIILISLIISILLFFTLAYFFPVKVIY